MLPKSVFCVGLLLVFATGLFAQKLDVTANKPVADNNGSYTKPGLVTADGSFSYNYPITLPAGTAGVAPTISLDYNSNAPNGFVGLGFTLSGFPAITRDTRYPVNFDENDRYMYEGQKLFYADPQTYTTSTTITVPQLPGDPTSVVIYPAGTAMGGGDGRFHTERESYDRIELFASPTATEPTDDANISTSYWKVTQKDGTRLYFGWDGTGTGLSGTNGHIAAIGRVDANGQPQRRLWPLTKVVDTKGNYYKIVYTVDGATGAYYPTRVIYTLNDTYPLNAYKVIDFSYEPRTSDIIDVYTPTQTKIQNRLIWITVRVGANSSGIGGTVFKKYRLNYGISSNQTNFSLLRSIQEWGSGGDTPPFGILTASQVSGYAPTPNATTARPPVIYTWSTDGLAAFDGHFDLVVPPTQPYQSQLKFLNGGGVNIIPGDFSGDGKTDFFVQLRGNWESDSGRHNSVYVTNSNDQGTSNVVPLTGTDFDHVLGEPQAALFVGDFDGDGDMDILRQPNNSSDAYGMRLYLSQGNGSFVAHTPAGNFSSSYMASGAGVVIQVGDFDGDGRTDFIRQGRNSSNIDSFNVYLSKRDNGVDGEFTRIVPNSDEDASHLWNDGGCHFVVGDFNGDGLSDFIRQEKDGWATADDSGTFRIHFSLGDGHFRIVTPVGDQYQKDLRYTNNYKATLYPGDFNGDGKTDFIRNAIGSWPSGATPAFRVYYSVGDGTFDTKDQSAVMVGGISGQFDGTIDTSNPSKESGARIIPGDFNGDGRTDFIRQEFGHWATDTFNTFQVYLSEGKTFRGYTPDGYDYTNNLQGDHGYYGSSGSQIILGDFNGDGKTDFFRQEMYDWANADNDNTFMVFYSKLKQDLNQELKLKQDLLTSVKALNSPYDIVKAEYTPALQLTTVIPASNGNTVYPNSVPNYRPRYLVTKAIYNDGLNNQQVFTYVYENGRLRSGSPKARADLGFERITKLDTQANVKTETTFYQTPPLQGLAASETVFNPALVTKSHGKKFYYSSRNVHISLFEVLFVFKTRDYDLAFDGDSASQNKLTIYDLYDDHGNLLKATDYGFVADVDAVSISDATSADNMSSFSQMAIVDNASTYIIRAIEGRTESLDVNGYPGIAKQSYYYYDNLEFGGIGAGLLTGKQDMISTSYLTSALTTYQYDEYGNVISVRDPKSNASGYYYLTQTAYDYTYHGYPVSVTNALNQTSTIAYDSLMQPVSVTDANNQVTQTVYDAFGRAIKTILPGDSESLPTKQSTLDLSVFPNVVYTRSKETAAGAVLESYSYLDAFGREIQSKSEGPTNNWITVDKYYDKSGHLWKVSTAYLTSSSAKTVADASQKFTIFAYDAIDRVISVTNPDGSTAQTKYFKDTVTSVDEESHWNSQTQVDNRIAQVTRFFGLYPAKQLPSTSTIATYRDKRVMIDNAGNTSTKYFDSLGRVVTSIDPDMGTWSYSYDDNGNVTQRTDARGVSVNYGYDALNRIASIQDTIGGTVTFTYDQNDTDHDFGKGRLTSIVYPQSGNGLPRTDSFKYDARGQLISQTRVLDGISKTVSRTFDPMGRVATLTYPTGETIQNLFDTSGQLLSVSGSSAPAPYVGQMTYLPNGKLSGMVYGNSIIAQYSYYTVSGNIDPTTGLAFSQRLSGIKMGTAATPASVLNLRFGYDRTGNVKRRIDDNPTAYSETYTYDAFNRLETAQSSVYGSLNYKYTPIDNFETKNGQLISYSATRPHAVSYDGTYSYTYDSNGNMSTRSDGRTFTYDGLNRLTTISDGGSYVYDGAYQRMIKTEGPKTTYYFFPEYEEEYDTTSGTPVLSQSIAYYRANGQTVAQRSSIASEGLLYVHADHLGSSTRMTDATGAVRRTQIYKPYGSDAYLNATAAIKHQFTGQEKETNGLYYYGARFYDPELGRFVSPDPAIYDLTLNAELSLVEQMNPYVYVLNNPVRYTDPNGLRIVSHLSSAYTMQKGSGFLGARNINYAQVGNSGCVVTAWINIINTINNNEALTPESFTNHVTSASSQGAVVAPGENAGFVTNQGNLKTSDLVTAKANGWTVMKRSTSKGDDLGAVLSLLDSLEDDAYVTGQAELAIYGNHTVNILGGPQSNGVVERQETSSRGGDRRYSIGGGVGTNKLNELTFAIPSSIANTVNTALNIQKETQNVSLNNWGDPEW